MKSLTVSIKYKLIDNKPSKVADKLILNIYSTIIGNVTNVTTKIKQEFYNTGKLTLGIESGYYRFMDFKFSPKNKGQALLFIGYLNNTIALDNIISIIHLVQVND